MNNHIDRERLDFHKFSWFFEAIKWKVWKQIDARYEKFTQLNIESIQIETWKKIEWILLDVDDCIAPAYCDILEENIQKINTILDSGIKIWILSNGQNIEERINKIQARVWNRLEICNTWTKPNPETFIKACVHLDISPENVIMVWDDIWVDGWALQTTRDWNQLLGGFVHIQLIWNSYMNIPVWKIPNYIFKNIFRGIVNYRNK